MSSYILFYNFVISSPPFHHTKSLTTPYEISTRQPDTHCFQTFAISYKYYNTSYYIPGDMLSHSRFMLTKFGRVSEGCFFAFIIPIDLYTLALPFKHLTIFLLISYLTKFMSSVICSTTLIRSLSGISSRFLTHVVASSHCESIK